MKIGEAQQIYREQVKEYRDRRSAIAKQLKDVRSRMEHFPGRQEEYASEAATLELTLSALDEKETEYQEYLDRLAEQYCAYWNATVADQQGDAAAEYARDIGKMMEVARRIMKGGIVPASDEKKLMEYSFEMYQTAKNIGALARQEKKEKYKSLWEDEEKKEYDDPREVAENGTAPAGAPDVVDVADVIESTSSPQQSAGVP